jgi:hypothetical protein
MLIRRITLLIGLLLTAGTSLAHHSIGGEFDSSRSITVTGTVKEVALINPHAYILIDVEEAGEAVQYTLTMGPAIKLIRGSGWTPDILHAGDVVTSSGRPMRKGNGMYIAHLVTQDGEVLIGELVE